MYGRDREGEAALRLFREVFTSGEKEGERSISPSAGHVDSPSGGSPVSPAQSSPKRICSWCKKVLQEGTEPATHDICPPCDRDVRAGFMEEAQSGLSRAEADRLSAIADAAEEDQRQADAKRRKDAVQGLLWIVRDLASIDLMEIAHYYNAHGDSVPSAIFLLKEQALHALNAAEKAGVNRG